MLVGVAHADIIQDQSWAGRNLGTYIPGQTFTADENALEMRIQAEPRYGPGPTGMNRGFPMKTATT